MIEDKMQGEQLSLELADKNNDAQNIIEAVLFVMSGAVSVSELAKACAYDNKAAEREVRGLMRRLELEDGALIVKEIDGKYQLCSNPKYFDNLVNVVSAKKKPELSDVFAVNKLIEYGLIEEAGKLNVPGRPALFRPTDEFYRRFGVENKYALPRTDEAVESRISDEVKTEVRLLINEQNS